ncbi:hypothetical protein G6F68_020196 [Rhizopus microsporus]|nr:hypothetical protein G6F68_020196 [Rhizopus microsporus]
MTKVGWRESKEDKKDDPEPYGPTRVDHALREQSHWQLMSTYSFSAQNADRDELEYSEESEEDEERILDELYGRHPSLAPVGVDGRGSQV